MLCLPFLSKSEQVTLFDKVIIQFLKLSSAKCHLYKHVNLESTIDMSESEILRSSETTFFKVCFTHTDIFLAFHHLPTCIISLMNTKKHVFGMYVFVYLVICVS